MYARFERERPETLGRAAVEIIGLEGVEGIIPVAEVIGSRLRADPECYRDEWLLGYACCGAEDEDSNDEALVVAALEERAKESENVKAYVDLILHPFLEEEKGRKASGSPPVTYITPPLGEILAEIEEGSPIQYGMMFGQQASPDDIRCIYSKLIRETRREQLLRYLWVFRRRELPELGQRIFDLACSEDEELRETAIKALSHTQALSVRELGIRLLSTEGQEPCWYGMSLFVKNYQEGDCRLFQPVLNSVTDPDSIEVIGHNIQDIADEHENEEIENCLLWLYEHGYCSYCRNSVLGRLIGWDAATRAILEECLWDCNEKTRTLAKETLEGGKYIPQ